MFAPKTVAFPTPGARTPYAPVEGLEENYESFDPRRSPSAKLAEQSSPAALFASVSLGFWQTAAQINPKERAVGEALRSQQYEIVREKFKDRLPPGAVGQGSFGMVYKARKGDGIYGIKMIEGAREMVDLVKKEIDTLATFRHPAMVDYVETLDFVKDKNWVFIVQEFVAGGDLNAALINQPDSFNEALCRVMIYRICCGMGYAHQKGVMHRDIKPENILLTEEGLPKLCDFGLSRQLKSMDLARTKAGTPAYMAPETMGGKPYDFSVDTFAIGLILRDMRARETVMEWCIQQIPPQCRPSPKQWPAGHRQTPFSDDIKKLMEKMSDRNPFQRPTCFRVTRILEDLATKHPMPHEFWGRPIVKPTGNPPRGIQLSRIFSSGATAEFAAKRGFSKGAEVQIKIGEQWFPGTVEHLAEAIVPGAVHVRYTAKGGESKIRVVEPSHFGTHLTSKEGKPAAACCTLM